MKFNIYPSVVQLSPALFSCCSRYINFVELIHVHDLLDDEIFIYLTNQRPAKIYHALTYSRTHILTDNPYRAPGFASNAGAKKTWN